MSSAEASSPTPRFTIVSAVYNVARYLGEFIDSIERQSFPLSEVQVIVVDDGSTDDSLEILEGWRRRRPELVTVLSRVNGGPSAARNVGLPHVRGEWVTFTDSDDVLDPDYLSIVDGFLRKHPETQMVATRRIRFKHETGEQSKHPLDRHFVIGSSRLRNLDLDTGHFHGSAPSSFFRGDLLHREQLEFEERIKVFEDGHFCNRYLLRAPSPLVGYVSDALYNYRHRDDGTSGLDRSWADPGRFTDVIEHGYLALLRDGTQRRGRAPSWLQAMIIYELSWYFKTNEKMSAPTAATGATAVRFHELLAQVCDLLDETGVQTYAATELDPVWRDILQHGYSQLSWHTPFGVIGRIDESQGLMRLTYRYTGELPGETFIVDGEQVEPVHQKIRDVRFFERTMLHERIAWLPFGTVRVVVNGEDLDLGIEEHEAPSHRLTGPAIKAGLDRKAGNVVEPLPKRRPAVRALVRLARSRLVEWYFHDAWVLVDRIFNADDSAEHLFSYLRTHRRRVNAWFVIERDTPDYRRLRSTNGRRVVAHGTLTWYLLMLNCQHLISSHIDDVIVRPRRLVRLRGARPWRITFLQHGVMKDDLSPWLNRKNIDLFVTSTQAEYESVVADHTGYQYTTREARLTGLPRFDRILEAGRRIAPDERDFILVAPTWREWLSSSDRSGNGRHHVSPDFGSSEFCTQWSALLNSPELRELAERTGLTVALLLHPNFQGAAQLDHLPHVRSLQFEGQQVQELFARARVLVTDYSSMFFNAAYIERPVVYFQFDRDRVLSGWHLGRPGYFDYERDGFGPVTRTVDDAIAAVVKAVDNGPDPEPVYLDRIRASFPDRDGRCCERVADAIAASTTPAVRRPRRSLARRAAGRARRELGRAAARARRPAPVG